VDRRYESYCAADRVFYDVVPDGKGRDFPMVDADLPDGWRRGPLEDWIVLHRPAAPLPAQGWKIHVSACLDNAERVLAACWRYCLDNGVAFKFLRSRLMLLMRNSKYASRGSSGKLVTIYPADEAACRRILTDLDALIGGEPGPYILSDLRINAGPLFVRYGGFSPRYCVDGTGEAVLAIENGAGELVPDTRGPVFAVPDWVELPDFLAPQLAARNATTVADLPYRIEKVLHFSNGGGIYRAVDGRTGDTVVLKEARPHAGLDSAGTDAVTRLEREHRMLTKLAGITGIPAVLDRFAVGEHQFLAMEYVAGAPLNGEVAKRLPVGPDDDCSGYAEWAVGVLRQVERTIEAVHERGVVYGDLHLFNVMVGPDGRASLLDFEVAAELGEQLPPGLRAQGFAAPRDRTGLDVDRYALACLRLAVFLPITSILRLAPGAAKAAHLAEIIADRYPLPDGFLAEAVRTIGGDTHPAPGAFGTDPDGWPDVRSVLVRAILASATPGRDDRLFPGDIAQFRPGGGLNLAHGAAGVLYALDAAGAGRHPEHEGWLLDRAKNPAPQTPLGLYDGLHGVAYLLDRFDHRQAALDLVDICLAERWERLGLGLSGGLAGIGLNLLHLAGRTGEPALRTAGLRAATLTAERLGGTDAVGTTSGGRHPHAGLLRGSSGPALLLLRAYDETGDAGYLDAAAVALRQDLRRCRRRADGSLQVDEGWRTMPYLADGSTGIGLVLDAYLARRADDELSEPRDGIALAARSAFYVQSGLFAGRAGIVLYLASRRPADDGPTDDGPTDDGHWLRRQARALSWHALPYGGGLAFPGEQLLRLSMDLATGTAGVLLALAAAAGEPARLPLLAAAPEPPCGPARVIPNPLMTGRR
jgi:hypothetical protein